MNNENIKLIEPTVELESEFLAMAEEYHTADMEKCLKLYSEALDDFSTYVADLRNAAHGNGLPAGWVPTSTFWLVGSKNVMLGTIRLRHRLTPLLEREGGHIGYDIRPSERRKGYGTIILALSLVKAWEMGLTRVLVTCDTDNIASVKIIEKNGGKFEKEIISENFRKPVSRYWIDLEDI